VPSVRVRPATRRARRSRRRGSREPRWCLPGWRVTGPPDVPEDPTVECARRSARTGRGHRERSRRCRSRGRRAAVPRRFGRSSPAAACPAEAVLRGTWTPRCGSRPTSVSRGGGGARCARLRGHGRNVAWPSDKITDRWPAGSYPATRRTSSVGPRSQRTIWAVRRSVATRAAVDVGDLGQVQRDRMLGTEHPVAALQRVLAQGAGCLGLAHVGQDDGQGGGRQQSGLVDETTAGHPCWRPPDKTS
jgi:hypothetical protein